MKFIAGTCLAMAFGFSTDPGNAFPGQACKDNAPAQRESRWITCVVREDGAIAGVGDFAKSWSPRPTACVIQDIQSNKAEYRVDLGPDKRIRPKLVPVFPRAGGAYLRAETNDSVADNLAELPSCPSE